ncbi:MAG: putative NRPS-like protein biosynthetic cluster [Cirrosporium novae-zelandiae]|nr:MAG: putative NRPS-like protein biosynthetic cluster [Cirrosporium novae-zelandiae]
MEPKNLYQLLHQASTSEASLTSYLDQSGTYKHISYNDLFFQAQRDAALINHLEEFRPEPTVLLHFDSQLDNIRWFWAMITAGLVPAMSTPLVNDTNQRTKHLSHLYNALGDPIVLTTERLLPEFPGVEGLRIRTVESLESHANIQSLFIRDGRTKDAEDLAVLMLTSGSTGCSKAVCLRHGQILAAVRAKADCHDLSNKDIALNWIGMDHVAGLIEGHILPLALHGEQIQVEATTLIVEPLSFLRLINKHRISYTFAPNFFFAAMVRVLKEKAPKESLDLTCLRTITSGGEANQVETCEILTKQLAGYGAPENLIRPGFGMTETCAGCIYSTNCPQYDLERDSEFASLGTCTSGVNMRVMNLLGETTNPGEVGELQVSGPAVFREYYNNVQATVEVFTKDGWFRTGDRAFVDSDGCLNLSGRSKETIIINGVKHSPHELETVLENAGIPGLTPSYTIVFSYRPKGSPTEGICVVYVPTFEEDDGLAYHETSDAISRTCIGLSGAKPLDIVPVKKSMLPKSTLGKVSRAKTSRGFETGVFSYYQQHSKQMISEYKAAHYKPPATDLEITIAKVLETTFSIPEEDISLDSGLFDLGIDSIALIRFNAQLQKALGLAKSLPLSVILLSPTVGGIAQAIEDMRKPKSYNPVVPLQTNGSKTPLWLFHPGVGEVLVFLGLARYFPDRPVYAIRTRGFEEGEEVFGTLDEVVVTYHAHIKRTQPKGPYAMAGYSYGSMLAYQVAKIMESEGDEVKFLGAFNLPPHIKERMQQLDMIEVLLHLSYFLGLVSEEHAVQISPMLHTYTLAQALEYICQVSPPGRLEELDLDKYKLERWAHVAASMQGLARGYEPQGSVDTLDVFVAIPLPAVAKDKQDWIDNKLSHWKDFVRSPPRFHDVDGAHYTMLSPENIQSFQKTLKSAMLARGL